MTLAPRLGDPRASEGSVAGASPVTCALISVLALWAAYFDSSDELVDRRAERTSNPILVGRLTVPKVSCAADEPSNNPAHMP